MGSTVSTNKQAYAFVTPQGRTAYVLFEESYEKNCYPHEPHWSAVAMGYLDEVLNDIFRHASSCEGGMLQHRGGHVLPETYLQRWLETLASPLEMPDVVKVLEFGESFYATLPLGCKDRIEELLRNCGMQTAIEGLDGRSASLYKDFDLLNAIYGKRATGAWRFITNKPFSTRDRADLGYTASLSKSFATIDPPPPMFRCGPEHVIVRNDNGEFVNAGWQYSVVGSFIANYGPQELKDPGSFKAAIKGFRDAVRAASQFDDDALVVLDANLETESYSNQQVQKVLSLFRLGATRIQIPLGQIKQKDQESDETRCLYQVLNCKSTRWLPAATKPQQDQQSSSNLELLF